MSAWGFQILIKLLEDRSHKLTVTKRNFFEFIITYLTLLINEIIKYCHNYLFTHCIRTSNQDGNRKHSKSTILYVTAAISGTEYSGEWAASDLLVTCTFTVALGNSCLTWPLYFSLWAGSTWRARRVVCCSVLYSYPLHGASHNLS